VGSGCGCPSSSPGSLDATQYGSPPNMARNRGDPRRPSIWLGKNRIGILIWRILTVLRGGRACLGSGGTREVGRTRWASAPRLLLSRHLTTKTAPQGLFLDAVGRAGTLSARQTHSRQGRPARRGRPARQFRFGVTWRQHYPRTKSHGPTPMRMGSADEEEGRQN